MSTTTTTERRRDSVPPPGISHVCTEAVDGRIKETVSTYYDHFTQSGDHEEDFDYKSRNEKASDISQSFYDLITPFYEYGYSQSFHFAPVHDGKSVDECISEYEHEIAKTLNARPGMKILVSSGGGYILVTCSALWASGSGPTGSVMLVLRETLCAHAFRMCMLSRVDMLREVRVVLTLLWIISVARSGASVIPGVAIVSAAIWTWPQNFLLFIRTDDGSFTMPMQYGHIII